MDKETIKTNNGKSGGLLVGKPHYSESGEPLGGIKAVVTDDNNRPVELEKNEAVITAKAVKKHWKTLSAINQDGGGVPILPPQMMAGGNVGKGNNNKRNTKKIKNETKQEKSTDNRIEEAISYISRSVRATKEKQPNRQYSTHEEKDLEIKAAFEFAKENNLLLDESKDLPLPITNGGNENSLFYKENSGKVFKVNNLQNHEFSILNYLKYILLHNTLFPSTSYNFVGFTAYYYTQNEIPFIQPVVSQSYHLGVPASELEISEFMHQMGFAKIKEDTFSRLTYVVSDLKPRNVIKATNGRIYVIDNIIVRQANDSNKNLPMTENIEKKEDGGNIDYLPFEIPNKTVLITSDGSYCIVRDEFDDMYYLQFAGEKALVEKPKKEVHKHIADEEWSVVKEKMFAAGGNIGFDALANKVAKQYVGEKVPKQYQDEYGKTYDSEEALEVGRKVAAKVYREQQMGNGGNINSKPQKNKPNKELLNALMEKQTKLLSLEYEYEDIISRIGEKEERLKSEIDKLEHDRIELLYAGLSENDKIANLSDCAETMTDECIHAINRMFEVINKSPYSCSVYSATKSWNTTVPDSYSVSDHWNFYSQGLYHKLTTIPIVDFIINKYKDAAYSYNGETKNASFFDFNGENTSIGGFWYLAQFKEDEKCYDEAMNDAAAGNKGAWVIIDAFPKDYDKSKDIREIMNKKRNAQSELYNLTPTKLISDIDKTKKEIELYEWLAENNYKSFEDFEKKAKKLLKEKYELIKLSLTEKINAGLVTGTVTKKEWSGSRGHFRLASEDTYSGKLISKTPATITIKTAGGNSFTGKDNTIDTSELNEDERNVFFGYSICNETLSQILGKHEYKVCINTNFKM